ncbi:glycosyl transferase family 90-domain-containing protein [Mycena metata]|uniref:Glycosyl transferase family 90-domain-containing protein n=1 Tax=Mycena metata TaxID=1033252 RepID=A0AAD7IGG6_9AGAR|nr:glycosyl transferase family 90-domain-containing protein [Mycena metata]
MSPPAYTHVRSQFVYSDDLVNDSLPGPGPSASTRSQWMPRRLQFYLPFTVMLGTLGLIIMASKASFLTTVQLEWFQNSVASQHLTAEPEALPNLGPTPNDTGSPLNPVGIADRSIYNLYARQSQTLEQAIARYTLRNGNRPPPMQFNKWYNFARESNCLIDDYDQITRDFTPFYQLAAEDPAHFQNMIDKGRELMLQDSTGIVAIEISNGTWGHILPDTMFLINGRDEPRVVFNVRDPAMRKDAMKLQDNKPFHLAPVPTSEFFKHQSGCSTLDRGHGLTVDAIEDVAFLRSSSSSDFTTDLWPILSMTKISPCFSDILFPGQYYYESSGWSAKFEKPNDVQWDDKKPQLYWRGQSNGGHIMHNNHHKFSRFRLVKIAQNRSDIIDAKMTGFWESHLYLRLRAGPHHRGYLLDVDGNTFSGRYLGLLRSGSLVFKATAFDEYFNDWLRPYEHYIPVEWAIAHDAEARQIQETGMRFAQRVLTDSQNDCYFSRVLLEWAQLQSYAKQSSALDTSYRSWLASGPASTQRKLEIPADNAVLSLMGSDACIKESVVAFIAHFPTKPGLAKLLLKHLKPSLKLQVPDTTHFDFEATLIGLLMSADGELRQIFSCIRRFGNTPPLSLSSFPYPPTQTSPDQYCSA